MNEKEWLFKAKCLNGFLSNRQSLTGHLSNEVLRGYSAYEIAVQNGFIGTEKEWLDSLHGENGAASWEDILNKPEQYPPNKHDHNELYYTKEESNSVLPEKVMETIVPKVTEEIVPNTVKEIVPGLALTPNDKITNEDIEFLFREKGWKL